MPISKATTVDAYLAELPPDRRATIEAVRDFVRANLPEGYVESMQYGMIGWGIPLSRFPHTYNGQPLGVVALAAQKRHNALYLMSCYADSEEEQALKAAYAAAGRKLDMGKSSLRFGDLDDLLVDAIAAALRSTPPEKLIAIHEAVHGGKRKGR